MSATGGGVHTSATGGGSGSRQPLAGVVGTCRPLAGTGTRQPKSSADATKDQARSNRRRHRRAAKFFSPLTPIKG